MNKLVLLKSVDMTHRVLIRYCRPSTTYVNTVSFVVSDSSLLPSELRVVIDSLPDDVTSVSVDVTPLSSV